MRIDRASSLKQEILGASQPVGRLERLVDIYLGFDQRYSEFMDRWAARMLLRASRAGEQEQLAEVFRRAILQLETRPFDMRATQARRVRAVHALEFLGETLTSEEHAAMQPNRKMFDLLSVY